MNWANVIVIAIIAVILGLAIYKIVKDKKSVYKCAGCPYAGKCSTCLTENNKQS